MRGAAFHWLPFGHLIGLAVLGVTVVGILELVYLMTLRPDGVRIAVSLVVATALVAGAAFALSRPAAVVEVVP
jgi:hypothetical protein